VAIDELRGGGDELVIIMTVTRCGGGGVAKLRQGIEGGVDRWSAHHVLEVGGGPTWHGDARPARGGRRVSPWLVGLCGLHRPDGRLGQLCQKPGKFPFGIK
jgi:hypothetical protein